MTQMMKVLSKSIAIQKQRRANREVFHRPTSTFGRLRMDEATYNARALRANLLKFTVFEYMAMVAWALNQGSEVTILPVPGREPWRRADLSANAEQPESVRGLVKSANT